MDGSLACVLCGWPIIADPAPDRQARAAAGARVRILPEYQRPRAARRCLAQADAVSVEEGQAASGSCFCPWPGSRRGCPWAPVS